jgi:flagellar biosynthesis/type III secretory pathway M-ring protein FliF/YscJ
MGVWQLREEDMVKRMNDLPLVLVLGVAAVIALIAVAVSVMHGSTDMSPLVSRATQRSLGSDIFWWP